MSGDKEESLAKSLEKGRQTAEEVVETAIEPVRSLAEMTAERFSRFTDIQGAGGLVLILAVLCALGLSNSPLSSVYDKILEIHIPVAIGPIQIDKPLLLWINDGLMAIFFFLVGLEVKREFLQGELRYPSQIVLPFVAALGGMLVPAVVYLLVVINSNNESLIQGLAIPTATDIAFALGILALLAHRIPIGLKVFLLSVAVFDDVGAILIIALFYGEPLSPAMLATALALFAGLILINILGIRHVAFYLIIGFLFWIAVLKSGVHATVAGLLLAFTIPIREEEGHSPLLQIEERLNPWVAFFIMPVFALANSGFSFQGDLSSSLSTPLTLAIVLGLVLGKPVGIVGGAALAVLSNRAQLPRNTTWSMILGAGMLAGIGFTISLFIGTLAFDHTDGSSQIRLAVLTASCLSAVFGYLCLLMATSGHTKTDLME